MIILGIDPGTRFAGYSILMKAPGRTALLESGVLKLSPTKTLAQRIGQLHDFFDEIIKKYQITDLALETPFLGKNAQNFLKLGYVRGILYLLSSRYEITLHEFSPREIKQAVTGFGGADKDQVARVVHSLFPGFKANSTADETDALAISLCCLWHAAFKQKVARAMMPKNH